MVHPIFSEITRYIGRGFVYIAGHLGVAWAANTVINQVSGVPQRTRSFFNPLRFFDNFPRWSLFWGIQAFGPVHWLEQLYSMFEPLVVKSTANIVSTILAPLLHHLEARGFIRVYNPAAYWLDYINPIRWLDDFINAMESLLMLPVQLIASGSLLLRNVFSWPINALYRWYHPGYFPYSFDPVADWVEEYSPVFGSWGSNIISYGYRGCDHLFSFPFSVVRTLQSCGTPPWFAIPMVLTAGSMLYWFAQKGLNYMASNNNNHVQGGNAAGGNAHVNNPNITIYNQLPPGAFAAPVPPPPAIVPGFRAAAALPPPPVAAPAPAAAAPAAAPRDGWCQII